VAGARSGIRTSSAGNIPHTIIYCQVLLSVPRFSRLVSGDVLAERQVHRPEVDVRRYPAPRCWRRARGAGLPSVGLAPRSPSPPTLLVSLCRPIASRPVLSRPVPLLPSLDFSRPSRSRPFSSVLVRFLPPRSSSSVCIVPRPLSNCSVRASCPALGKHDGSHSPTVTHQPVPH
jgi:hypothetical protein